MTRRPSPGWLPRSGTTNSSWPRPRSPGSGEMVKEVDRAGRGQRWQLGQGFKVDAEIPVGGVLGGVGRE